MAADKIILQRFSVLVWYAVLRHGAEACVDTVDELVLRETFQEIVGAAYFSQCFLINRERVMLHNDAV